MKVHTKIICGGVVAVLAVTVGLIASANRIMRIMWIHELGNKPVASLTANEKCVLLESLLKEKKDSDKTAELLFSLMQDPNALNIEQKGYVADRAGQMYHALGNLEAEKEIYDYFLKDEDPDLYRLYMERAGLKE